MNQKDDGGPAFPHPINKHDVGMQYAIVDGMSLRDWFAGQYQPPWQLTNKMVAELSDPGISGGTVLQSQKAIVELKNQHAKLMLEARKQYETTELQQLCREIMEDDWGYLSVKLQNKIRQGAEGTKQ